MKRRIRRKIVKRFCLEYGLDQSFVNGWLAASQWYPGRSYQLRAALDRCLDDLMDIGYGPFCR